MPADGSPPDRHVRWSTEGASGLHPEDLNGREGRGMRDGGRPGSEELRARLLGLRIDCAT